MEVEVDVWGWLLWRCERVDCSWVREPGVALPEEEPPLLRKRDMPSEGMLASFWFWDRVMERGLWVPVEVAVADTEDICGARLWDERPCRRRFVRASASGNWCAE